MYICIDRERSSGYFLKEEKRVKHTIWNKILKDIGRNWKGEGVMWEWGFGYYVSSSVESQRFSVG